MVRSIAKRCVPNHEMASSFETRTFGPLVRMRRHYIFASLSLSAFPITLTEESAIAAAPTMGESRIPNTGYSTPAAIGTPPAL